MPADFRALNQLRLACLLTGLTVRERTAIGTAMGMIGQMVGEDQLEAEVPEADFILVHDTVLSVIEMAVEGETPWIRSVESLEDLQTLLRQPFGHVAYGLLSTGVSAEELHRTIDEYATQVDEDSQ